MLIERFKNGNVFGQDVLKNICISIGLNLSVTVQAYLWMPVYAVDVLCVCCPVLLGSVGLAGVPKLHLTTLVGRGKDELG